MRPLKGSLGPILTLTLSPQRVGSYPSLLIRLFGLHLDASSLFSPFHPLASACSWPLWLHAFHLLGWLLFPCSLDSCLLSCTFFN